jgi:hypothetical protein
MLILLLVVFNFYNKNYSRSEYRLSIYLDALSEHRVLKKKKRKKTHAHSHHILKRLTFRSSPIGVGSSYSSLVLATSLGRTAHKPIDSVEMTIHRSEYRPSIETKYRE